MLLYIINLPKNLITRNKDEMSILGCSKKKFWAYLLWNFFLPLAKFYLATALHLSIRVLTFHPYFKWSNFAHFRYAIFKINDNNSQGNWTWKKCMSHVKKYLFSYFIFNPTQQYNDIAKQSFYYISQNAWICVTGLNCYSKKFKNSVTKRLLKINFSPFQHPFAH